MNFDHLTEQQKEEFKKDVLKLSKPDNYIMDEENLEGYYKAKIQILTHALHGAANLRDEYKMQLDAAMKENTILKEQIHKLKSNG